ncbi:hypothetical protein MLD38_010165 [Melastoma candidum]|uniref:Uncharacterized protein n=1 Tax=Melastoma candidum TaxID=119954 RepID=A0ACB9QYZ3_9MYRT|nr:hypothetical protein MLD38_010165 [Melastoma candidum]
MAAAAGLGEGEGRFLCRCQIWRIGREGELWSSLSAPRMTVEIGFEGLLLLWEDGELLLFGRISTYLGRVFRFCRLLRRPWLVDGEDAVERIRDLRFPGQVVPFSEGYVDNGNHGDIRPTSTLGRAQMKII